MTISFNGNFSSDDFDATLRGLGNDVFFVQIGAMDGVTHDPICKFVIDLGWKGLLVEPIPYLNKKLRQNYANRDGLVFAETAIADFEGRIEMAFIDPDNVKLGVFEPGGFGTSTLMRDRGLLSGKNMPLEAAQIFRQNTTDIEVPCCRLNTLFAKHEVAKIDLMVIDVEGADWMVARQLSLEDYHPRIVYLEYNHLSAYEQIACAEHFRNYGYKIYIEAPSEENFLAVK
jgi:FkbM family methyltransferase